MDILNKTNIQNKILRAPEFGDEGGGGASSSSSNVINIGGVEVDKFYLGNSDDVKIYLGDVLGTYHTSLLLSIMIQQSIKLYVMETQLFQQQIQEVIQRQYLL